MGHWPSLALPLGASRNGTTHIKASKYSYKMLCNNVVHHKQDINAVNSRGMPMPVFQLESNREIDIPQEAAEAEKAA